jgi:hypothetical protein
MSCGRQVIQESTGATTGAGGGGGSSASLNGSAGSVGTSDVASSSSAVSSSSSSSSSGVVMPPMDAGPMLDSGMPSTTYPAFTIDPPQVFYYSGPVLASPKLVPVFFADYDKTQAMSLADFETKLPGATFWTALAEYGVNAGTTLPTIALTEMSPGTIDDAAIGTWLAGKLNGNDPAWPPADDNTVYILHYPSSNTITLQGSTSCQSFGGYHNSTSLDVTHGYQNVAYAVIPDCGQGGIDGLTTAISHEIAEAATDPYVGGMQFAYYQADNNHAEWMRIGGGGEVGDMCAGFNSSFATFPDLPYGIQRIWGNKAAKAGHDWCQPSLPGEVFFNAMPVMKDHVTWVWQQYMASFLVKGVKLDVGQEKTIDVDLYSDAATSGPWTVTATDTTSFNAANKYLDLTLDNASGVNGEILHLTIKVNNTGPHGYESFQLKSSLGSVAHEWFGVVAAK